MRLGTGKNQGWHPKTHCISWEKVGDSLQVFPCHLTQGITAVPFKSCSRVQVAMNLEWREKLKSAMMHSRWALVCTGTVQLMHLFRANWYLMDSYIIYFRKDFLHFLQLESNQWPFFCLTVSLCIYLSNVPALEGRFIIIIVTILRSKKIQKLLPWGTIKKSSSTPNSSSGCSYSHNYAFTFNYPLHSSLQSRGGRGFHSSCDVYKYCVMYINTVFFALFK